MHYVVIDEEFCKVTRGARTRQYGYPNEIIQIGAVMLDENYAEVGRFNEYVNPQYGYVDSFIEKLTGINRYRVKQADALDTVLRRFMDWLPEDTVIVSWSMTDRSQLYKEAEAKGLLNARLECLIESWIDAQSMFTEKINGAKVYKLEKALNMAGIVYGGTLHDGLDDAVNTALLYGMMQAEDFRTVDYYLSDNEEPEELSFSLGNLFVRFNIA